MQNFDISALENFKEQEKTIIPETNSDNIGDLLEIPTAPAPILEESEEEKSGEIDAKEEKSEEEKKQLAARNAQMYVTLVDLLVSRGCSLFTGAEIERYKLSKSEKEEYTKVSEEYFLTINATVSPAAVFIVSTLTIFSSIFFRAYMDYKAKKKKQEDEKKAKEMQAAETRAAAERERQQQQQQQQQQAGTKTSIIEQKEEQKKEKRPKYYKEEIPEAVNSRSNFEIYQESDKPENSKTWKDSLIGKYKRSPENDRWTYDECLKAEENEPSPILKMMIGQKLTEGKTWKEINLELRKFLRSLPEMIENE